MATIRKRTYQDKNGKRRRTKIYFARYKDQDGVWREKSTGCTDKAAAQEIARRLERDSQRRAAGILDPFEDHRLRPLAEHLKDFEAFLETKGNTREHVSKSISRIRAALDACSFRSFRDISASRLQGWLAELQQGIPIRPQQDNDPAANAKWCRGRIRRGLGVGTTNNHLVAMKMFTRWLVQDRRAPDDPLIGLTKQNVDLDRRHERRALTPDEILRLLDTTRGSSRVVRGLDGHDRSMLYALAVLTGFRVGELTVLRPGDFDLESTPATVSLAPTQTKNRKAAVQPIPSTIVPSLREYLRTQDPATSIWPPMPNGKAAQMLRADLEAAGIPYRDEAGHVVDFHALRHTYCTMLAQARVSPKTLQVLARHHSAAFTLDRYAHAAMSDLADAVDQLPVLDGRTNGRGGGESLPNVLPKTHVTPGHLMVSDGTDSTVGRPSDTASPVDPQVPANAQVDVECHSQTSYDTDQDGIAPGRGRTPHRGIWIPASAGMTDRWSGSHGDRQNQRCRTDFQFVKDGIKCRPTLVKQKRRRS